MIRIFSHYVSKTAFILLLLEVLILLVSALLTSMIWLVDNHRPEHAAEIYLSALVFAVVVVFSMSALGMYQHSSREDIRNTLLRIMPSFALGFALLSLLVYMVPAIHFGRGAGVVFGLGGIGVVLARLVVFKSAQSTMMEARLILVGSGALARECIDLASSKIGFHQFTVVGCIDVAGEERCVPVSKLLPEGSSLLVMAQRYDVHEIVVSVTDRRNGAFPVRQLLECALGGVKVIDAATFFERESCQIRIDSLQPSYLIYGGGFDQSFVRATSKRLFDLVASALICVAALPVMLLTSLAIWLEDGGPVFYQQERVGRDGSIFNVLKFRSMRCDAEQDGKPQWASADDPRVTRVGHIIRKLRIDELPQMLNVFKGEMSFVGPRPERAYFVDQLKTQVPYYDIRHSIKPGVTGLAQVRYQYGASVDDAVHKLQYDLYYVKNNSLFLDLLILLDTVQVVLFGKGGR
ncbi:TIGR03013 family XrtA/PEP-CTERM system glycosyltransferase [Janthinobacterium agaricidamnosum]|uniref:Sugar transferase, PEP-CTERM system associated family protein n=1 Tax=Janthinobacterium agaricidamnosum NBRC 102515 = DSM 9628 TaxID=1349767 RepID=W0V2C6_9BURK|nr:TIGR03013 family XrtA/PEP-CTERM system glycosyltransferase [Janthinobacterium agaricidamnosum]CDG82959.1 sugar transferase, PEP-CTERM system associated family protein [Janthinobacterium agaricidamnosum NBRC 102515 = DSM 9628]